MSNTKKNKKSTSSRAKSSTKTSSRKKTPLEDLQQTNGKLYEPTVDQVRKLEEILEVKKTNPFGTNDLRIFEENVASMNLTDMQEVAVRAGVFPSGNRTVLKNKLIKAFKAEGFGINKSVVESDHQVTLDPKNKKHKEIIDYLNS
jgi:hypothetical protein